MSLGAPKGQNKQLWRCCAMGAHLWQEVPHLGIRIHLAPPWSSTVPTKSPSQWEQLRNQQRRLVLASVKSCALKCSC